VAVKVQYPGLAARVASDLAVMRAFNTLAAAAFRSSYRLGWMVDELEAKLSQELDFRCASGSVDES
jgi:predicted unusual protein kinase regulating ubiquinone biosynthesis (AarF/ABC1/UbiB family)